MTYAVVPAVAVDFSFSEPPYIVETSAIDFLFDSRPVFQYSTPPSRIKAYASHWQVGSSKLAVLLSGYSDSIALNVSHTQVSNKANVIDIDAMSLLWGAVAEKEITVGFSFDQSDEKEDAKSINWSHTRAEDSERIISWDKSISPNDQYRLSDWQKPDIQDRGHIESITSVGLYINKEKQSKGYLHPQQPLNFTFRNALYQPIEHSDVFFRLGEFDPVTPVIPLDVGKSSPYRSNQHKDELKVIPWGFGQKIRDEEITGSYGGEKDPDVVDKPEPEQPEIRESYLLMNTITTVVLPDRVPLELPSLEISLDIDSFSWSLTGQLIGATNIALVEPDQNGPKQIEVNINGWKWVFIIERYSTDRRFGNERYTIYGSSRTQLLAAPYAPIRSKSNSSDLNAKQAITEELGNTGFTAIYPELNDYSTPDWIMPAGSFSYQNHTAMQVVAKIAGTAGSVVIPSRETDQLNIHPRYPASP